MDSVFFIPSNRDASRAITSFAKEVQFAFERDGRRVPFVVSETDDRDHVRFNAEAIRAVQSKYPEIPFYHLTTGYQKRYFDILLDGQPAALRDIFLSQEKNYGTAQNKLLLMTSSFGAEAMHRRDSDCVLLFDERPDVEHLYPIEAELEFLGQKVSDTRAIWQSAPDESKAESQICVVGGNYVGSWNIDVKDFGLRSMDIIYRLYEILGFDPEFIVELCDGAYPIEEVLPDSDEFELVTNVNDHKNPDAANFAMYKLHEYLPNVPGRNMLAADYTTFDCATAIGLPAVHHNRPLFHTFERKREEYDEKLQYWEGMARFTDYFNQYGALFEGELDLRVPASYPLVIPDEVLQGILGGALSIPGSAPEQRRERIDRLADEILIPFDDRYASIGRHIKANAARFVRESDEDYQLHALLLEHWPSLIARAKQISIPELYQAG